MAKTIAKRPAKKAAGKPSDDATANRANGNITAAYILEAVGLLAPHTKQVLDSLNSPGSSTWEEAVEDTYGINKTFVRSVYALCLELKGPPESALFILQGLGCHDPAERLLDILRD